MWVSDFAVFFYTHSSLSVASLYSSEIRLSVGWDICGFCLGAFSGFPAFFLDSSVKQQVPAIDFPDGEFSLRTLFVLICLFWCPLLIFFDRRIKNPLPDSHIEVLPTPVRVSIKILNPWHCVWSCYLHRLPRSPSKFGVSTDTQWGWVQAPATLNTIITAPSFYNCPFLRAFFAIKFPPRKHKISRWLCHSSLNSAHQQHIPPGPRF